MTRILALAAAASLALSPLAAPAAFAQPIPAKPKKVLVLLAPEEVDPARLLPPPPAEGTPRAVADLAAVRQAIATASPERVAAAHWDDEHESPALLQPTLGAGFDMAALPATAELLAIVQTDADVTASAAKKLFLRKRPWAVDAAVKTCDPDDKPLSSYPSGHATLGYALALTLAAAAPERAQALLARAADYGYSREICGSHFPDDVQASEALATAVVGRLMLKPEFQAKLAAARAELRAHGLAH